MVAIACFGSPFAVAGVATWLFVNLLVFKSFRHHPLCSVQPVSLDHSQIYRKNESNYTTVALHVITVPQTLHALQPPATLFFCVNNNLVCIIFFLQILLQLSMWMHFQKVCDGLVWPGRMWAGKFPKFWPFSWTYAIILQSSSVVNLLFLMLGFTKNK
jgi:hypothetical protein